MSASETRVSVLSLSDLSLNLNSLEALIVSYGFHYHKHTDDISDSWFMLTFPTEVSNSISEHLTAVSLWMSHNFLTLNTGSRRFC